MGTVHLIRGVPGSGKTRTLSLKAAAAVDAYGASNVAIASLTKAAAVEIAGRDTNVPDQNVGTLHAHAYRALECSRDEMAETRPRLREFAAGHPELDAGDHGHETDLDEAPAEGSGLHGAVMNHRARLTPPGRWTDDERAYHTAWTAFKQRHGLRDFTDLIERCADEPELMPAVKGLFFDESQDFSALELKLALGWAAHVKTTVICADVDQAIYGWRGADPAALEALPYGRTIPLLQSYRCSRAVRDLALAWIAPVAGRTPVTWEPTDAQGSAHQAPFALCDHAELLDRIDALLAADDGTVMLLTTCGYMLTPVLRELRDRGVPFANEHRRKETRWNPMRGKAFDGLRGFLVTDVKVYGEQSRPRTWGDLWAWAQLIPAKGTLARGAKAAIEAHCMPDQFNVSRAGETVPLGTLIDLLGTPMHPALRNDVRWLADAMKTEHRRAGEYAARVYERDPAALATEPRLTVGTAHSVKGASATHVLLAPDLSHEGFFGEHGWHGDGADAIRRLAYVAITRARESVTVLEPSVAECMPLSVNERGVLAA